MTRIFLAVIFLAACHEGGSPDDLLAHDLLARDLLAHDLAARPPDLSCTDLGHDVDNCGTCGNACTSPANSTARCDSGTCAFDCNSGFYASGAACVACSPCAAGAFATGCTGPGDTVCEMCPAGTDSAAGSTTCSMCAAGTYSAAVGSTTCAACDAGTFAASAGSTSCTTCSVCASTVTACTLTRDAVCCPNGMAGLGTAASPCLVTTCADLQAVSALGSVDYRLKNDVDCSSTGNGGAIFSPISNLTGDLDGNSLAVAGLVTNLLANLSGTVHDLTLTNVTIMTAADTYVGALAGVANGAVTNCHVSGTISAPAASYVGGLVGVANSAVTGCSSSAQVTGLNNVGGLVGVSSATISSSTTTGTITGANGVGGLVAVADGAVTDCSASGAVSGAQEVGGLAGVLAGPTTRSFATGNVTASDTVAGGLSGELLASADQCYATGTVTGTSYVGGLVGYANAVGAITNSYARGDVTASAASPHDVGGLLGVSDYQSVSNSYATGNVSSPSANVGGLGGMLYSIVGPCFATGTVSAGTTNGGVAGAVSTTDADGSFWYEAPGTAATHCIGGTDSSCTAIPVATGISYFYTVSHAPMSAWSFGAGNPWSSVCDGVSFPVLTFQNVTSPTGCK